MDATQIFIGKSKKLYPNKFSYEKLIYINSKTKLIITCIEHGDFLISPNYHLSCRSGCKHCSKAKPNIRLNRRNTTENFIKRSREIHGEKYDYSLVKYEFAIKKITIICKNHGPFEQVPNSHLMGTGCWNCAVKTRGEKRIMGNDNFIEKSRKLHNDLYDYSLVEYVNSYNKVKIICAKHGIFGQTPAIHLRGGGCIKCHNWNLSREEIVEKFKETHGNKYDYSLMSYAHCKNKIKIICPTHGLFYQTPDSHVSGKGCEKCGRSKNSAELKLLDFLKSEFTDKSIIWQARFDWLGKMSLDMFFPDINVGIEYHGRQHFKAISFFGGEEGFAKTQKRDNKKFDLCTENKVKIIYFTNEINEIPKDFQHTVLTDKEELKILLESYFRHS